MFLDSPNYQQGVDRVVAYYRDGEAEHWTGVARLSEDIEGGQPVLTNIEGQSVIAKVTPESFGLSLSVYDHPKRVESEVFNLSYRIMSGESDFEIHLVYNCITFIDQREHISISDVTSPELIEVAISALPMTKMPTMNRPSAHFILKSGHMHKHIWEELEKVLYGTDDEDPRLPNIDDLIEEIESRVTLRVIDHGDGTWSAIGPDDAIDTSKIYFTINWVSARYIDTDTYKISSY